MCYNETATDQSFLVLEISNFTQDFKNVIFIGVIIVEV